MKASLKTLYLLLCSIVIIGCNRGFRTAKAKFQSDTFAQAIKSECESLLSLHNESQQEVWKASDLTNYPAILSLQPQAVLITKEGDRTLCEIQITGGFDHAGIFYVAESQSDSKPPRRGDWEIEKIRPGFYSYRE